MAITVSATRSSQPTYPILKVKWPLIFQSNPLVLFHEQEYLPKKESSLSQIASSVGKKEGRKKVKIGGQWTTESLSKFEFGGGISVLNAAEQKNDTELLTRIRGYDLFSCEAQYHISSRKQYVNTSVHWRSSSLEAKTKQSEMEMAHQAAFNGVCVSVDKALIAKQGVCKMTDLLQLYVSYLQESPFPNPNFRSEKLKVKLMNAYPKSLSFVQLAKKGKFRSQLVYSSAISTGNAVSMAYELSSADRARDVAVQLRKEIKNAFQSSDTLPWP